MKPFEPAYNAAAVLAQKAHAACMLQDFIEKVIMNDCSDDAPQVVKQSERLAQLLSSARKHAELVARLLLAYTEEWIRLYRSTEEAPAPGGRKPTAGDTPSCN